MEAGGEPDRFWHLTPRQIAAELMAANARAARQRDEIIFAAWHTAAFSRVEKLPKLETLLKQQDKHNGKRRKRSWQEIEAAMHAMTHRMKSED